jgi:replicative DNA helicase
VIQDHVPPHHVDAELALIGSALVYGGKVTDNVDALPGDDFFLPAHNVAWKAIRAASAKPGSVVDPITVGAEIRASGESGRFADGWDTWAMAAARKACLPEQVDRYATMVREAAAARRMITLCADLQSRAYNPETDWRDLLLDASRGIGGLELCGGPSGTRHIGAVMREVADEIQRYQEGDRPLIVSTGISTLDNIVDDLTGGQVVIIAARPSCGKTALACQIATNTGLQGIPSLMFSLETNDRRLSRRILASATKCSTRSLQRDLDYAAWKKIQKAAGEFDNSTLWINDQARELTDIIGESKRWYAQHVRGKADHRCCVFIDYAQLVKVIRQKNGNREQDVAMVSREIKELAIKLNAVIFLLAQLGREVERRGGSPMLSDLRESASLEQDADVVLFPHRDLDPTDLEAKNKRGPALIIVGKHKEGETGPASVEFLPDELRFICVTDREEPPPSYYETDRDRD